MYVSTYLIQFLSNVCACSRVICKPRREKEERENNVGKGGGNDEEDRKRERKESNNAIGLQGIKELQSLIIRPVAVSVTLFL